MAEKGTRDDPRTGTESDISKAQSQQQPPEQAKQQSEMSQSEQLESEQAEAGQLGEEEQSDTLAQQRTDIEGASLQSERSEAEGGFVGSESDADSSSELVEDQDFAKKGQGAPEGK